MKTLFRMCVAGAVGALVFSVLVKLGASPEGALAVSILAACVLLVLLGGPGASTPVPIIDARTRPKGPVTLPGDAVVVTHGPDATRVDPGDLAAFDLFVEDGVLRLRPREGSAAARCVAFEAVERGAAAVEAAGLDAADLERRMAYMRRTPIGLADSTELTLECHYDPPDSWFPGDGGGLMIGADGCVYEAVRATPIAPEDGDPLKTDLEFRRRDDLGRWELDVADGELVVSRVGLDLADGPDATAVAISEARDAHERVMHGFDALGYARIADVRKAEGADEDGPQPLGPRMGSVTTKAPDGHDVVVPIMPAHLAVPHALLEDAGVLVTDIPLGGPTRVHVRLPDPMARSLLANAGDGVEQPADGAVPSSGETQEPQADA